MVFKSNCIQRHAQDTKEEEEEEESIFETLVNRSEIEGVMPCMNTFHDHWFTRALTIKIFDLGLLFVVLFDLIDQGVGHLTLKLRGRIDRRWRSPTMMKTSFEIAHAIFVLVGEMRMTMEERRQFR